MPRILLLNKPYNVLCQFTDTQGRATLADYIRESGLYPAGRLDRDSEGLVILTDDGALQHCIAHPSQKQEKTYWVQVEGIPDDEALERLRKGVLLNDGPTRPARVERMEQPALWDRHPPIRYRANIPTSWIQLSITEGRNRQVRRMTAAVGYPTLRLVRWRVGNWNLDTLEPGEYLEVTPLMVEAFRKQCPKPRQKPQAHTRRKPTTTQRARHKSKPSRQSS